MTSTKVRIATFSALALAVLMASCAGSPSLQGGSGNGQKEDQGGTAKLLSTLKELGTPDQKGLYRLHHEVSANNAQTVKDLLTYGAKVDVTDPSGRTPLRYAVDRGYASIARLLVDHGANPFIADVGGTTPAEAAIRADTEMTAAVFNVKNINLAGADGRTILHYAANNLLEREVALLLELGASPKVLDKANRSPLDLALMQPERIEAARIAEKLIQRNVEPSYPEFAWFSKVVRAVDYGSERFDSGNGPLHEAIRRRQYGIASFFISRKVSPNAINALGETPLHLAAAASSLEGVTLLLKAQADSSIQDLRGDTPLHRAVAQGAAPSVAEALIASSASVNLANHEGDTPVIIAMKSGAYQYADMLIRAGADILVPNKKGESALLAAMRRGTDAVDILVRRDNANQRDAAGNSVIASAVTLRCAPEVLSLILSKGADPNRPNAIGETPLHIAVRANSGTLGPILLEAKADIFAAATNLESPLILALTAKPEPYAWFFTAPVVAARDPNGDTPLHHAARRNLPAGIKYLLDAGADIGATNAMRETALHAAVRTDAEESTRLLVSLGMNLESRDSKGNTALNMAVFSGSQACMRILVLSGSQLDSPNFSGESAIHLAVLKGNREALRFLLDRGAAIELRDSTGLTPLSLAARGGRADLAQDLLARNATIDARDSGGKTPLQAALESGSLEIVRLLVKGGADILARDSIGEFPLALAFRKGASHVRELLTPANVNRGDSEGRAPIRLLVESRIAPETLETIIQAGGTPDGRDRYAETALHAAIRLGDNEMARRLVAAGCDPFASDYKGKTPASLAFEKGDDAIKALVEAAGVSRRDRLGAGFLHYAARAGNDRAVDTLLALGVDRKMVKISGETASDVAASGNYPAIADKLH